MLKKHSKKGGKGEVYSPYVGFSREEWAHFRKDTPLTLTEADLGNLRGINDQISMDEVVDVYLPLSRLLNLYVAASQELHQATYRFLGGPAAKVPFIIGLAGSVAVGKSTIARILQALLSRWADHVNVALITTDGFLYPNARLASKNLMRRKGFPESYDVRRLIKFVADLKAGKPSVTAPVYSHLTYDILPGKRTRVNQPDIVILEGINVLQNAPQQVAKPSQVYLSDFFDFSIYVDADPLQIESWFLARFHQLRDTAFKDPDSYFHRYAHMTVKEADLYARSVWTEINAVNLVENIAPTRERADLILHKAANHAVESVKLRKL
ncbi:MAG: type I pantothenate kinase [Rhodothermales bacterium]